MAASGTKALTHHLRRIVLRVDGAGMTDGQLVEAFIRHRDSAAFEALLRRHGPMVLGVCRRVLRHPHDAEDAFQATFLVLARKAASVIPRENVGNWLYGVAYTTAVRARAANAKRRLRERQVANMPEPEAVQKDLEDDLRQRLDEELARLPHKYRVPLVLCDLEGRTRREVARQLKVPEGTLSSRLTTGRRMLAKRITRRGLAVTGGSLAMAVSHEAASACVPVSLAKATAQAAMMDVAGQTAAGLISVQVAALTEGVLKAMFLTKVKTVMGMMLVFASLGGAAGLIYQTQAAEQRKSQQANEKADTEKQSVVEKNANLILDKQQRPKDDLNAIRGGWRVISVQQGNKEGADKEAAMWEGSRWLIQAESIDIRSKDGGAVGLPYKLDPSRNPKIMDLKLLGRTIPGVYALDGDILQIRMGLHETTRPKALSSEEGDNTMLLILQREPVQKPKPDKERLQGTWKIISKVDDGEKKESAVGDEWTFKDWAVRAKDQPKKKYGAYTSYLCFRLDEKTNPKRIDFVDAKSDDWSDSAVFNKRLEDADLRIESIYALAGDTLKICISRKKGKRPTTFESEEGSDYILLTLQRHNPKDEEKKPRRERKKDETAGAKTAESVGYIPIKIGPRGYRTLFIKMLGVLAEVFEQIIYANQYEGRIEAYKIGSDTSRSPVQQYSLQQHAFILFEARDNGYLIAVRINKVRMRGTESEQVVGRNIKVEQAILKKLNAQPVPKDSLPPQVPPARPKESEKED